MAEDWNSYSGVQITPRLEGAMFASPQYHMAPDGSVVVSPRLAGPEGSVIVSPRLHGTHSGPLLVSQIQDTATLGGLPLEITRKSESSWSSLDCCGGWFRTFGVAFVAFLAGSACVFIIDRTVLSTGSLRPGSIGTDSIVSPSVAEDARLAAKTPSEVGCYPAINEEDGEDNLFDWTCADNPQKEYCRMGLPFFHLRMASGETLVDCVSFCLSKMMDLCGISVTPNGANVCRCGASENNYLVWGDSPARANLLLPRHLNNQDGCSLRIYKTPEKDDFDSILAMTEINADESTYIAGVTRGMRPDALREEEKAVDATPPPQPIVGDQDEALRFCYPHACADGGVWTTKQGSLVVINYYFSGLGPAAKATFAQAAAAYERTTCLRFRESSQKPTFRVDSSNPNSCSATVGFPGTWGEGHLNMGWCNSMASLGNVIHEIGHIIGRTHTQRRPDATRTYMQQGPFLKINWENVPTDWRAQYTPSKDAYIGSNRQSATDPFEGHMRYDYASIMSYGPGGVGSKARMEALDPTYQSQMGQRDGLTDLDILTIKDMYQCGTSGAVPVHPNWCFAILLAVLVKAALS
eukprot:TRINITY_DN19556_c0_g2_i1.p1 TRINITY_DN19556_c0_g2~~TRINITY_DN19556_c0_g2_i1.p1  ORF type:complete len:579 (-),score=66.98 TRINITY_DN19556_c0_g2_i1:262-1998(-)